MASRKLSTNRSSVTFDGKQVDDFLAKLKDPKLRESLARRVGVAGGTEFRDEAKARAPKRKGLFASAIYLAYKQDLSGPAKVVYSITWNSKKAPHGHLIEYGHWRYNTQVNGRWQKSKSGTRRLKGSYNGSPPAGYAKVHDLPGAAKPPVWVAAEPTIGPSYTAARVRAVQAMVDRTGTAFWELFGYTQPGARTFGVKQ